MKITAYIHEQATEFCYFTVNGVRFTEKPMLGKQVHWYNALYNNKDNKHIVNIIRAKHFKKPLFVKFAEIDLKWPEGFEYLNVRGRQRFTSYNQLIQDLNTWLKKKHPSYFDPKIKLLNGSFMPQPKLSIKTRSGYAA